MAGILLNRSRQAPAEETPAFGGIAERFRRAGDLDRAIALCRDGLKRFPDQLSARVTLGWALLDKGQYEEARGELERVLRKAPDNLAAIRGLAELHDRAEGAMATDESWHHDEAGGQMAAAQPPAPTGAAAAPVASVAAASVPSPLAVAIPAAPPAVADDPFAPIAVSLPSAGIAATPELMHTAQQAGLEAEEAAAGYDLLGTRLDDDVRPVEIEDLAAASMAAAGAPVAPPAQAPIELADPATVAFSPDGAEVEAEIATLESDVALAAGSSDGADFSDLDLTGIVHGPAASDGAGASGPDIDLLADLSATFADGSSSADLNDAIKVLSTSEAPSIDFGSADAGAPVEEADPEVAAAAEALRAISFDDAAEEAGAIDAAGLGATLDAPPEAEAPAAFATALGIVEPDIELEADAVAGVELIPADASAVAPPILSWSESPTQFQPDEAAPESIAAVAELAAPEEPAAGLLAFEPELEPEPEPTGPVFELVAPVPVDIQLDDASEDQTAGQLAAASDLYAVDLFAAMSAEPEPVVELPPELEPVLEAEQLPPAVFGAHGTDEADEEAAEHFVDVADAGPARVPAISDFQPVIERAAFGMVAELVDATRDSDYPVGTVALGLPLTKKERSRASVVALERLLKKVETRRLQLQSESVA